MVPIFDEVFADSELTLSLAGTLDMIGVWPGSTTAELSRRGHKTQQAFSQLAARLEKIAADFADPPAEAAQPMPERGW